VSEYRFSVLIVNFNGMDRLSACLKSLAEQTFPGERFDVLVLDNASTDGSPAWLERFAGSAQPFRFRWFLSDVNLGFAGGNNRLAEQAEGEYFVLLNPDTAADPFWLEELDRSAREHPDSALASKLVLLGDPQRLNSTGLFLLRDGRGADRGFRQIDDGRYEAGGEVFAGCAAALAIPKSQLNGPIFDERLFLYCEDLDLGWRRRLAGLRTVFCPRAVILHAVGAGGSIASPHYWFFSERNRALVAVVLGDPSLAMFAPLGLLLRAIRAIAMASIGREPWPKAIAILRAVASFALRLPRAIADRYVERMKR